MNTIQKSSFVCALADIVTVKIRELHLCTVIVSDI